MNRFSGLRVVIVNYSIFGLDYFSVCSLVLLPSKLFITTEKLIMKIISNQVTD